MPKFSVSKRAKVYLRDRFQCQFCGRSVLKGELSVLDLTLDHLNPQAVGGNNSASNLLTACQRCNDLKASVVFDSLEAARHFVTEQLAKRERRLITLAIKKSDDPIDRFDLLDLLYFYNGKEVTA